MQVWNEFCSYSVLTEDMKVFKFQTLRGDDSNCAVRIQNEEHFRHCLGTQKVANDWEQIEEVQRKFLDVQILNFRIAVRSKAGHSFTISA